MPTMNRLLCVNKVNEVIVFFFLWLKDWDSVNCSPSMCKALGSIPGTTGDKRPSAYMYTLNVLQQVCIAGKFKRMFYTHTHTHTHTHTLEVSHPIQKRRLPSWKFRAVYSILVHMGVSMKRAHESEVWCHSGPLKVRECLNYKC
jgi:hypothetical protein